MLQKMGGPGVPAAGELERACRIFQGCHLEVQARASILQPKLMNPHQEINPRINENDTKLVNKGNKKKKGKKKKRQIHMPAGKFLSDVQMLSPEVFRWLTGLIRRGRCE